MLSHLRKIDWPLVLIVLLLCGVGLLTIYHISTPESFNYFRKQLAFVGLGFLIMLGLSFFDYRVFKNYSSFLFALYLASVLLLVLVLFSGEIRGTASWFKIGPFNMEPIEFVKVVVILFLAKYFSLRHIEMYRIRHLIVSGSYIAILAGLVIIQPDLGSALVLISIWLGMVLIAGIKMRHLIVLSLLMAVLFAVGWFAVLKDYQKNRILVFLNPEEDPYGQGYHISQSLIAIGSGKFWGRGVDAGSQAGLKFLPEQHTDFIFATFAEQRGLVGAGTLFLLFALLFWRMIKIGLGASNNFARLYAVGFSIMIFVQLIITIGMNLSLLPITGLTLPFISYGGSSLISVFIGLGILQSIKARSNNH